MNQGRSLTSTYMHTIYSHLMVTENSRYLFVGALYVLILIGISCIWNFSNSLDQSLNPSEELSALIQPSRAAVDDSGPSPSARRAFPKVRRSSTYAITDRPTGVISLTSRREACTAILIHEQLILTEGVCAQAFGQGRTRGQHWVATAKYLSPKSISSRFRPRSLSARVVESEVHPRLKLAVHLLDRPLSFVPLKLGSSNDTVPSAKPLMEFTHKYTSSYSSRHGNFVLSQDHRGMMAMIRGRIQSGHYRSFTHFELTWLEEAQALFGGRLERIGEKRFAGDRSEDLIALSRRQIKE